MKDVLLRPVEAAERTLRISTSRFPSGSRGGPPRTRAGPTPSSRRPPRLAFLEVLLLLGRDVLEVGVHGPLGLAQHLDRPSLIQATRSQIFLTVSRSWLTKTMVFFRRRKSSILSRHLGTNAASPTDSTRR